jgi:hypothetical protein
MKRVWGEGREEKGGYHDCCHRSLVFVVHQESLVMSGGPLSDYVSRSIALPVHEDCMQRLWSGLCSITQACSRWCQLSVVALWNDAISFLITVLCRRSRGE